MNSEMDRVFSSKSIFGAAWGLFFWVLVSFSLLGNLSSAPWDQLSKEDALKKFEIFEKKFKNRANENALAGLSLTARYSNIELYGAYRGMLELGELEGRGSIAAALYVRKDSESGEMLKDLLGRENEPQMQAGLISYLANRYKAAYVPELKNICQSETYEMASKLSAAYELAKLGDNGGEQVALNFLTRGDPLDPFSMERAVEILEKIGNKGSQKPLEKAEPKNYLHARYLTKAQFVLDLKYSKAAESYCEVIIKYYQSEIPEFRSEAMEMMARKVHKEGKVVRAALADCLETRLSAPSKLPLRVKTDIQRLWGILRE